MLVGAVLMLMNFGPFLCSRVWFDKTFFFLTCFSRGVLMLIRFFYSLKSTMVFQSLIFLRVPFKL
jgi:hypothetical protein